MHKRNFLLNRENMFESEASLDCNKLLEDTHVVFFKFQVNSNEGLVEVSSGVNDLLGYTAEELCASGFDESTLLHPHDRTRFRKRLFEAKKQTHTSEVYRLAKKGGGYRSCMVETLSKVEEQNSVFILGIAYPYEVQDEADESTGSVEEILFECSRILNKPHGGPSRMSQTLQVIVDGLGAREGYLYLMDAKHVNQANLILHQAAHGAEKNKLPSEFNIQEAGELKHRLLAKEAVSEMDISSVPPKSGDMAKSILFPVCDESGHLGFLGLEFEDSNIKLGGSIEYVGMTVADLMGMHIHRREIKQQLESSRKRYKALFDQSVESIFLLKDHQIVDVNQQALDLFGFEDKSELIGKTPLDISPSEQRDGRSSKEFIQKRFEEVKADGLVGFNWHHQKKDGTLLDCRVNLSEVHVGDTKLIQATVMDISDRIRREQRMKLLERCVNQFAEMLFVTDNDVQNENGPHIIYANQTAAQVYEMPQEQMRGKTFADLNFTPRYHEYLDDLKELMQQGEPFVYEVESIAQSGKKRIIEINAYPVFDDQKEIEYWIQISKDVTETKQIQDELEKERQSLKQAQELAHMGNFSWDVSNDEVEWSDELYHMMHIKSQEHDPDYEYFFNWVHPEDKEWLREKFEQDLIHKREMNYRYRVINNDGQLRQFNAIMDAEYNDRGEPKKVIGTIQDITEIEETREELNRLTQIANKIMNGVYITDSDEQIIWANQGFQNLCGYSMAELQGRKPVDRLLHDQTSRDTLQHLRSEREAGNYASNQIFMNTKGGEGKWVQLEISPIMNADGSYEGAMNIISDIDDLKQTEEDLRYHKRMFEQLFENSPVGLALIDRDQQVQKVNDSFTRIFGFSAGEIQGQNIDEVLVPDELLIGGEGLTLRTLKGDSFEQESVRIDKQGNEVPVLVAGSPVIIDGQVEAIYGMYVDISARVEAENNVRKSLAEKSVLLQEVHHRVKNNMAIIKSMFELQADEIDDPKAKEALHISSLRIHTMAKVHELLYRSSDLMNISLENYLTELLISATEMYGIWSKGIQIHLNLDDCPININQAIPLGLLMNELVSNACEHAFTGKGDIWVTSSITDQHIRLQVRDNGVGLDQQIVERFNEGEEIESVGLGIVQALAQQLHADSEFKSEPEKGTEIVLNVPR